ncbi:unnamed protein product [Prunus brigantina]
MIASPPENDKRRLLRRRSSYCFSAGKDLSLALCSDLLSHGRHWCWLRPCGLRFGIESKAGALSGSHIKYKV